MINTGRVKFIKRAEPGGPKKGHGYGFITDDAKQDRFFSYQDLVDVTFDALQQGAVVSFEPYTDPARGLRARQVRVIS